jgi:hypothetical protein
MKMKKFAGEPNLLGLGLSRRWEGVMIGILSTVLIGLLCWGTGSKSFATGLFYPGYLAIMTVESLTNALPSILAGPLQFLVALSGFALSIIIPAIIGSLIISKRTIARTSGIILLVIHTALWIFFSFFFHIMAD